MTDTSINTPNIDAIVALEQPATDLECLPRTLVRLNDYCCIRLSGEESESFLQSQLTNDIAELKPGAHQINGYCNPKGRALSVFRLLRSGQEFYILLPADLSTALLKRLQLYKMRAKVEITLADNLSIVGALNFDIENADLFLHTWQLDAQRAIGLIDLEKQSDFENRYGNNLPGSELWRIGEIISGTPQVYESTSEEFIPQHINLDLISGVSFTKGCYPGQEIVARLRYLGKLKQRMIAGTVTNATNCEPGSPVYIAEKGNQKAGAIVESAQCGQTTYVLATVPSSHIEKGLIRVGNSEGPIIDRIPLPYPITIDNS
jgi:folate-binding protein YgfZ